MRKARRIRDPIGWLVGTVRDYGFEHVFKRYYGIYRAVVIDNADPDNRLRVRVQVPSIGHLSRDVVPENVWALPCMDGLSVGEAGWDVPAAERG
jgi:hypothetical protein